MSKPFYDIEEGKDDEKEPKKLSWSEWFQGNKRKLIIGGAVTSICIGVGLYVYIHKSKDNRQSIEQLNFDDSNNGFKYAPGWHSVAQDVGAKKWGNRVAFHGVISHDSPEKLLPLGTMFTMPEGWRPEIHKYRDCMVGPSTDARVDILPDGSVQLQEEPHGWYVKLDGLAFRTGS